MSVDIEALKTLAQEKKLPLERLINAIENCTLELNELASKINKNRLNSIPLLNDLLVKILVQLGMTDDSYTIDNSEEMTYREFTNSFLPYHPTDTVEIKSIVLMCEFLIMKLYFCNQKKSYISFTWKQARTRKTP